MKDYIEINKKVYDELAEEYKKRRAEYAISDRKLITPFCSYLKKQFQSTHVLELGHGSGLALSYLVSEGFDTTAIDISQNIINISKEVSPSTNYILDDFLEHDFGGILFEGIFAKAFIHLFTKDDATKVLLKMRNLLVDEGVAFIGTTVHEISEEGFFEKHDYQKKLNGLEKGGLKKNYLKLFHKQVLLFIKNVIMLNLIKIKNGLHCLL